MIKSYFLLLVSVALIPASQQACAQSAGADQQMPPYRPAQVAPSREAGYLLPDGTIRIIGLGDMQGIIAQLNMLYATTHPGIHFTLTSSNSLAAIYSLIFDATAFAPAGIVYPSNLTYTDIVHGAPFAIRVAHGSLNSNAEVSPLAIVVNRSNPLSEISMAQVASIFTQSARARVFTRWGQVGVTGAMAADEIHPYGLPWTDHYPSEDTGFGEFFFYNKLKAAPPVENYSMRKTYADVATAISADPDSIGVIAINRITPALKIVAISENDLKPPMTGTPAEIRSGQYPLDRDLYLYVRVVTGRPLDPFVKDYMNMVLSREGQEIIRNEAHGYIPLNAVEVQEDLASFQ